MSITKKTSPETNRLTFVLLAVFMIGFGLLAEHHAQPLANDTLHAQTKQIGH